MLRLEKRPDPSKTWGYLAPVLAVIATMVGGGVMFSLLGKDPFEAIRTIFYDPLFSEFAWYYRPQLLIKGAPLILIAIGLSMGLVLYGRLPLPTPPSTGGRNPRALHWLLFSLTPQRSCRD